MTNRFDEAAQLKVLTGRRDAIIEREQNPCSPNYAILERIKIERDLLEAARWLTEVARCFQKGDAEILHLMRKYLAAHKPDGHLIENGPTTAQGVNCMDRMLQAAKIMEEKL